MDKTRRQFLKLLGKVGLVASVGVVAPGALLAKGVEKSTPREDNVEFDDIGNTVDTAKWSPAMKEAFKGAYGYGDKVTAIGPKYQFMDPDLLPDDMGNGGYFSATHRNPTVGDKVTVAGTNQYDGEYTLVDQALADSKRHLLGEGQEWYRGVVRKHKDKNKLFNMQLSDLAQAVSKA